MSRWKRILVYAFILVMIWITSYTATLMCFVDVIREPYIILKTDYKPDCTPAGDVHTTILELNAIRKAVPAVSNIHATGLYSSQQLLLSTASLFSPSLTEAQMTSQIQEMTLHPLGTGIPDLDRLNRQFGAVRLERLFDDWITIHIGKPFDMSCVAEEYQ